MSTDQGPLVQRALLSVELGKIRRERRLKQEQVAKALDWSSSKLIRIEGGSVGISTTDLQALLRYYDVTDEEITNKLIGLARGARERGWWSAYQRDLGNDQAFLAYLGYENGSSHIRQFASAVMPGPLQTEEYARALTGQFADEQRTALLVEIRMLRQEKLLDRTDPPQQHYILDEAVIRRRVGASVDESIMPAQLRHVIEVSKRPYVTLQVLPFQAGEHFGMKGDFTILDFDGDLGEVLYLESSRGGALTITGRDPEITNYRDAFERLITMALGGEDSRDLIERAVEEMARGK